MNYIEREEKYGSVFTWQHKDYLGTEKELDGYFVHIGRDFADAPSNPCMPLDEFFETYYPIYLHGQIKSLERDVDILIHKVYINKHSFDEVDSVKIFNEKGELIYTYPDVIEWQTIIDLVMMPTSEAFYSRQIPFDYEALYYDG